ncbi:hypothetical protein [Roseomonas chloroacetimidivorans]|uniref:hypothetical protein n=1 Tax=Roseomonas chloroacetimidivorans TaxID=1766656 RepID=UPI003C749E0A
MRKAPRTAAAVLLGGALATGAALAQPAADTVTAIRARGAVACAVAPATAGFALPDARGVDAGLDVHKCRAVAAAILGDAREVRYVPATPRQRVSLLQSGKVDLLARNTT